MRFLTLSFCFLTLLCFLISCAVSGSQHQSQRQQTWIRPVYTCSHLVMPGGVCSLVPWLLVGFGSAIWCRCANQLGRYQFFALLRWVRVTHSRGKIVSFYRKTLKAWCFWCLGGWWEVVFEVCLIFVKRRATMRGHFQFSALVCRKPFGSAWRWRRQGFCEAGNGLVFIYRGGNVASDCYAMLWSRCAGLMASAQRTRLTAGITSCFLLGARIGWEVLLDAFLGLG